MLTVLLQFTVQQCPLFRRGQAASQQIALLQVAQALEDLPSVLGLKDRQLAQDVCFAHGRNPNCSMAGAQAVRLTSRLAVRARPALRASRLPGWTNFRARSW